MLMTMEGPSVQSDGGSRGACKIGVLRTCSSIRGEDCLLA